MEATILNFSAPSVNKNTEDELIASLNPLDADEFLSHLPKLNKEANTVELVLMLVDILPSLSYAQTFDAMQANAAMRDIGFLLGSLKRHRVEPYNTIPQLEEKLNLLASFTNLPPRDTLLHYTIWNPNGHRRRTYTGTEDENYLIESVKIAMNPLKKAIYSLRNLYHTSLQSPGFPKLCEEAIVNFSKMIEGVVLSHTKVSPVYFANELRLYFDPIYLNNREYLGPGAVEMPMFVYDHILWSCDCEDEMYTTFKETYLPYILPELRDIYDEFKGMPSLINQACWLLNNLNHQTKEIKASAKSLLKVSKLLRSFRMPHKKMAEESYNHSKSDLKTHGSGGYTTGILSHILKLSNEQINKLEQIVLRDLSNGSSTHLIEEMPRHFTRPL